MKSLLCLIMMITFYSQLSLSFNSPEKRELKAEIKIFKRFEKNFKRMSKKVNKILNNWEKYENELVFKLQSYEVRANSNISSLPGHQDYMDILRSSNPQEIRKHLAYLTSDKYKAKLVIDIKKQIKIAGSNREYLKELRRLRKPNWCLIGKVSAGIAFAPALALTVGGGLVLGFMPYFYAPIFWPSLGAILGGFTTLSASGFQFNKNCRFVRVDH